MEERVRAPRGHQSGRAEGAPVPPARAHLHIGAAYIDRSVEERWGARPYKVVVAHMVAVAHVVVVAHAAAHEVAHTRGPHTYAHASYSTFECNPLEGHMYQACVRTAAEALGERLKRRACSGVHQKGPDSVHLSASHTRGHCGEHLLFDSCVAVTLAVYVASCNPPHLLPSLFPRLPPASLPDAPPRRTVP